MKLIVGLGNPGLKYSGTRHNIGFKVVKLLAKKHNIGIDSRHFGAKTGAGSINNRKVILALPQKFMNLSGAPTRLLAGAHKIAQKDLLVVCDDVNLGLGLLRMRAKGSAGGHKGLISIIENLGGDDFSRLRVGIGKQGLKGDITDFVLGNFTQQEKPFLPDILAKAVYACESWIESGSELTAAKFNRK